MHRSYILWHGSSLRAGSQHDALPMLLQQGATARLPWKSFHTGRLARGVATAGGAGAAAPGSLPSANRRMIIARPSACPFSSRPTSVQTGLMNEAAEPGNAGNTCVPAKYGRVCDSGFSAAICAPADGHPTVRDGGSRRGFTTSTQCPGQQANAWDASEGCNLGCV